MKNLVFTPLFSFLFSFAAQASGVDLHAHLFMQKGLGKYFNGGFFEPIQAIDWKGSGATGNPLVLDSKANAETLNKSGYSIVVVSLASHKEAVPDIRQAIRDQITEANKFIKKYPNWAIAKTPSEARNQLSKGKKVLVLSLEDTEGILETESDLVEFIDKAGIKIVNLIHLEDNCFGGAALAEKPWVPGLPDRRGETNELGLAPKGRALATKLLDRGVWLDLSHASDRAQIEIKKLQEQYNQPPIYTHTVLRQHYGWERGINVEQIQYVKENHGIVGLMPIPWLLTRTPVEKNCAGGVPGFTYQYNSLAKEIGPENVFIGSDINAAAHLHNHCSTGTELDVAGYRHIGQTPELVRAMKKQGALLPQNPRVHTFQFLEAWEKAYQR